MNGMTAQGKWVKESLAFFRRTSRILDPAFPGTFPHLDVTEMFLDQPDVHAGIMTEENVTGWDRLVIRVIPFPLRSGTRLTMFFLPGAIRVRSIVFESLPCVYDRPIQFFKIVENDHTDAGYAVPDRPNSRRFLLFSALHDEEDDSFRSGEPFSKFLNAKKLREIMEGFTFHKDRTYQFTALNPFREEDPVSPSISAAEAYDIVRLDH